MGLSPASGCSAGELAAVSPQTPYVSGPFHTEWGLLTPVPWTIRRAPGEAVQGGMTGHRLPAHRLPSTPGVRKSLAGWFTGPTAAAGGTGGALTPGGWDIN